ncbi:hypothetical protein BH11MYX4_BH11MYX4_48980 [soil metagenome]
MYFSDLHVQILARGILQPGEVLVGQTVTDYMPWWAFGLIRRQHLVLATDQRVVVFDHRYDLLKVNQVLVGIDSLPWASVAHVKVSGIFKKKLKLRGTTDQGKAIDISAKIPSSFMPWATTMKNNMEGAKGFLAAHQSRGQGCAPALWMGQQPGYGALAQSTGPAQPYGVPLINAPGYNSSPPPPPGPYGAPPPSGGPFAPPRQY